MSWKATAWAGALEEADFPCTGTTARTAKLVLMCLANHHTEDRGCFPKQETLERETFCSHSTLNRALTALEEHGLIVRQNRGRPGGGRGSTHYILCMSSEQKSQNETIKSLKSGGQKSQNEGAKVSQLRDTEQIEQKEQEGSTADADEHTQDVAVNVEEEFQSFVRIYPHIPDFKKARKAFLAAALDYPANRIVAAARAYANEQRGNSKQYLKMAHHWLTEERWTAYPHAEAVEAVDENTILEGYEDAVRERKGYLLRSVSDETILKLIQRGNVTKDQLSRAGVI